MMIFVSCTGSRAAEVHRPADPAGGGAEAAARAEPAGAGAEGGLDATTE